jgi:SH3-like domain-containing protein
MKIEIQLKLYKNRGDSAPSVLINKSQTVKIIGTDNNEWCLIKTANDTKGWIAVDKYNIIRNNGLEAWEVFDGLCYAD